MFENAGEIIVLAMAVTVTWMVAWGVADWRFSRYERRVRSHGSSMGNGPSIGHGPSIARVPSIGTPPCEVATIRLVAPSTDDRRGLAAGWSGGWDPS